MKGVFELYVEDSARQKDLKLRVSCKDRRKVEGIEIILSRVGMLSSKSNFRIDSDEAFRFAFNLVVFVDARHTWID